MTEAHSVSEAINFIFIGLKYFLIKHFKKTALVLLILLGSALFVVIQYFQKPLQHEKKFDKGVEKVIPKP